MDHQSWQYIAESIKYISIAVGFVGVAWAVGWTITKLN